MAIYVNENHTPADGGKPFKHIIGQCADLQARALVGFAVRRMRNTDANRSAGEGLRRRCPRCFTDLLPLDGARTPAFLAMAAELERAHPDASWVYDLRDPATRDSQVGMATDLAARLWSRWKATRQGGYPADTIPWLNRAIAADASFEPEFHPLRFDTREEALAAEALLRDALRANGWFVSSDV